MRTRVADYMNMGIHLVYRISNRMLNVLLYGRCFVFRVLTRDLRHWLSSLIAFYRELRKGNVIMCKGAPRYHGCK